MSLPSLVGIELFRGEPDNSVFQNHGVVRVGVRHGSLRGESAARPGRQSETLDTYRGDRRGPPRVAGEGYGTPCRRFPGRFTALDKKSRLSLTLGYVRYVSGSNGSWRLCSPVLPGDCAHR